LATSVARRAVKSLEESFCLGDRDVTIRASIGIATGNGNAHSVVDLLRNADIAMYGAKSKGKARFELFDADMHAAALRRLQMKTDLERAISSGEFTLRYQPIVDLREGKITGVEALVRWDHPERGLVSPAEFIPLAEDTGLIVPLGRWVLREACRQAGEWQQEHPRTPALTMSVNVSAKQLVHPQIADDVAAALRESGIAPATLTLEITESVLMSDTDVAIAKLDELRRLGLRIAVDDFGTGYSSLGYLSSLPIDILKLDKTFVDGVALGPEDSAIARAVVNLGNSLSLMVVAEGIESKDQLRVLQKLDCDRGQGFFFAKPLDVEGIQTLLLTWGLETDIESTESRSLSVT
jgi:EAL domain-containing protein (putative c-di-GMP-specific phosphodiesterase class I)